MKEFRGTGEPSVKKCDKMPTSIKYPEENTVVNLKRDQSARLGGFSPACITLLVWA